MEAFSPAALFETAVAALVLILPGSALYLLARQVWGHGKESGRGVRNAPLFGIGLSIAFWPLLLLYTSLIGIPFAAPLLWAVMLVSTLYVGWRVIRLGGVRVPTDAWPAVVALVGLTLLAFGFRLGDLQGLVVPMFGDSLHHTMITTMILDRERVPTDWLPYVPVGTFTYHFGFHTLSAVLAQLLGLSAPTAVLIMGQALNAIAVPAAYLLNRRLFGSRLAGLGAALITGFISIMPSFYVNWGRYTQLSGHVLLAVSLVFIVAAMQEWRARNVALAGFCVAGLVVVHYRVLIFFGLFVVALAIWQVWQYGRERHALLKGWGRGLVALGLGAVVALPWIIHLLTDYIPNLLQRLGSVTPEYLAQYNDPGSIRIFVGTAVSLLALVGLIAAIAGIERRTTDDGRRTTDRRWTVDGGRWTMDVPDSRLSPRPDGPRSSVVGRPSSPEGLAFAVAIWMLLLIASLWIVPGAIGGYTVAITLYIPLSALGGFGIERVSRWAMKRIRFGRAEQWIPAMTVLAVAPIAALLTGTWHIGQPNEYSYVHSADLQAFEWIKANTPSGSKFVISSEFSYAGRGLTATDAGMWLPLLAGGGRTVSIPASITGNERPINPEFFTNTRQLAAYTQPVGQPQQAGDSLQVNLVAKGIIPRTGSITGQEALDLVKKLGCTYAYSGAPGGLSTPRLDVGAMRRDPAHFTLVYSNDGVYVFVIKP